MTKQGILCAPRAPPAKESPAFQRRYRSLCRRTRCARTPGPSRSGVPQLAACREPWCPIPHTLPKAPPSHSHSEELPSSKTTRSWASCAYSSALLELWHPSSGSQLLPLLLTKGKSWCRRRDQSIPPRPSPAGKLLTRIHELPITLSYRGGRRFVKQNAGCLNNELRGIKEWVRKRAEREGLIF